MRIIKINEEQKNRYFLQNKNFKIILIAFIIIIKSSSSCLHKKNNLINNSKETEINNTWIKKNTTEILNNYLSNFEGKYNDEVKIDIDRLKHCFSLKILLKKKNSILNYKEKRKLINLFKDRYNKNFINVKNIFIEDAIPFGNRMIILNNIIYYSEILNIKNIYLNSAYNWFIKNDIITGKIHISVIDKSQINCFSKETFCAGDGYSFFFPINLKPERRLIILKEEIKNNLPKIEINKEDLYIYIRSGDSFSKDGNEYTPAPYCFYKSILSNFKFKKIYLISMDNSSPVTKKLLSEYSYIIFNLNSLEKDLSMLFNAYNLVNSVSSFSQVAISLNDNLINLFEYDVYKLGEKIYHLHYDIDKLERKFNIYRMKPSKNYYIKMFTWRNTDYQRRLLFEEKCPYKFKKTNSNDTFLFDLF